MDEWVLTLPASTLRRSTRHAHPLTACGVATLGCCSPVGSFVSVAEHAAGWNGLQETCARTRLKRLLCDLEAFEPQKWVLMSLEGEQQVRFCRYRFCATGELKYRGAVG